MVNGKIPPDSASSRSRNAEFILPFSMFCKCFSKISVGFDFDIK